MAAQEIDANEESELEKLDKELTKLHGNNYKGFTQDKVIFDTVEKVPLVSVSLNKMLEGGLALGRIIELFGPSGSGKSSVALHTVSSYQKHGLRCAWIDAESAYTDTYARMCGVDTRKLAQMRPETANDALETMRSLAKSGLVSLIVLDSVAALVPKDEFEKDVGGGMIGSLARLMSSSLKQLAHYASDNNCSLLFINQERASNIGGYGCFQEETLVTFADGTNVPIKKVVEEKLVGPVISYDDSTGKFLSKPITNWFNNGRLNLPEETWYNFLVEGSGGRGGKMGFSCTPNHEILTASGYKQARELKEGDSLVSWYETKYLNNPKLKSIIFGSLLGDGSLVLRDKNTACLQLQNNSPEQEAYVQWKLEKMGQLQFMGIPVDITTQKQTQRAMNYKSLFSSELAVLRKDFYVSGVKRRTIPNNLKLDPLMAAVWFMDDGSADFANYHQRGYLSAYRLFQIKDEALRLQQLENLRKVWIEFLCCQESDVELDKYKWGIRFTTSAFRTLSASISPYVIPCMEYKLCPADRGNYRDFEVELCSGNKLPYYTPIVSINTSSARKLRNKTKYDLEIADSHNFVVGGGNRGVVVHNSKTTTCGGNSLTYYCSIRIDLNRTAYIEVAGEKKGLEIRAQTVKNKCGTPFKEANFSVLYPDFNEPTAPAGLDIMADLLQSCLDLGIVSKQGSWLIYNDLKIQGIEKFKTNMRQDETLVDKLRSTI